MQSERFQQHRGLALFRRPPNSNSCCCRHLGRRFLRFAAAEGQTRRHAATVNGQPITESRSRFAENELGGEIANLPPEVARALAEYLIDNELFAKAAEEAEHSRPPRSMSSRCAT